VISASLGWNKDPLMKWAWRMGREGKDFEKIRQKAADAGTLAHAMCERHLMDLPIIPPGGDLGAPADVVAKATTGFAAFLRWFRQTRMKPMACELKLVSERYRFGGTVDVLLYDAGTVRLGDFKTSKRAYADHLVQTRAYVELIREVLNIECETVEVLSLGRESARFKHASWPVADLDAAWATFLKTRELYDLRRTVEALL
jgi:hypothetical protein